MSERQTLLTRSARRRRGGATVAGVALWLALATPAMTAQPVIEAREEQGYARIVLKTDGLPRYEVSQSGAILVVTFDRPLSVSPEVVAAGIPAYVSASRRDPDSRGLRFALARSVRVNTMQAANDLYIDLLPPGWDGAPPSLPADVVADLSRRAIEAERLAQEARARQASEPPATLDFQIGRHPTFTRLSFAWDKAVEPTLARAGDLVTVAFDKKAEIDVTELEIDPPAQIRGAEATSGDDSLTVTLDVAVDAQVRGFWDAGAYVVDVIGPAEAGPLSSTVVPAGLTSRGPERDGEVQIAMLRTKPRPDVEARLVPLPEPAETDAPAVAAAEPQAATSDAKPQPSGETASEPDASQKTVAAPAEAAPTPQAPASAETAAEPAAMAGAVAADAGPALVVPHVAVEDGTTRLNFAFDRMTPAAMFSRGGRLWLVFETEQDIAAEMSGASLPQEVAIEDIARHGAVQLVRLRLDRPLLVRAWGDGPSWRVGLGEAIADTPETIDLRRERDEEKKPVVVFGLEGAARTHRIVDPASGETIVVVAANGPAQAMAKPQAFVEFSALATAHGLALLPRVDDMAVALDPSSVTVGRETGLTLSMGGLGRGRASGPEGPRSRTGFIEFAADETVDILDVASDMVRAASFVEDEAERLEQRLDLTRLLLSHRLAPEALGVLQAVAEADPKAATAPDFLAMRGVANVVMGRPAQARADLQAPALAESQDAHLWLSRAAAMEGRWTEASEAFALGEEAVTDYPPAERARFRLAALRAAIESGDLAAASLHAGMLGAEALPTDAEAERLLLAGRLAEALGRPEEALHGYRQALGGEEGPISAEARLRLTALLLKAGEMDLKQAGDALEQLTIKWRGDDIETQALHLLSDVYARQGEYRGAFRTMKVALREYPDAAATRSMEGEMSEVFGDLFLDGEADGLPAVRALALYYDFRELTPPGRRGDEMIRRLADRLVSLDLLPQAAQLLEHQVSNRLRGAARAEVAAKLALVHLMDGKPERALRVLNRSRQAMLPQELQRQRSLLEARALTELGRTELAAELLGTLEDGEAERARADAMWVGENWQGAAEAIELVLAKRYLDEKPLGETERYDVLRTAIAYTLAGDQIGLDRIRGRFLPRMAETPDAYAFEVVSRPIEAKGSEFSAVAEHIAAIDTLGGFLQAYRARYFEEDVPGPEPARAAEMASPAQGT